MKREESCWSLSVDEKEETKSKLKKRNTRTKANQQNDDDDDDDDDNTGSLGPPGTFGNLQETFTTKDIKTPHQNHENEASVDYQDHCTVVPVIGDTSKCTSQMSAF